MASSQASGAVRPLSEVLSYQNANVVAKFRDAHNVSQSEADEIFEAMKKWLWLCATAPSAGLMTIQDSIVVIDEMWHTFILFTKDYANFCSDHFGQFIHHVPIPSSEIEQMRADAIADPSRFATERLGALHALYTLIYDRLGRDTLIAWYTEYPMRFQRLAKQSMAPTEGAIVPRQPIPDATDLDRDTLLQAVLDRNTPLAYCSMSCGAYCRDAAEPTVRPPN